MRFDDLPILCRRHTTSKLRSFAELPNIRTLGFRGEALCSISRVGRLTVTTRPVTSSYGMHVQYLNEEPLASPVPCAAHIGTTIVVDFDSRQASKLTEEAAIEIFRSHALHYVGVGFSLERSAATKLRVNKDDVALDRLSKLYGIDVAKNAVQLNAVALSTLPGCCLFGYGSWKEVGRSHFVVFINDRCVDCRPMKKAIEAVYTDCLPKKIPFVYLSLRLPSENVDINVHPAKREVAFLHKEQIVRCVAIAIREAIHTPQLVGQNKGTYIPQIALLHSKGHPVRETLPEECRDDSRDKHWLADDNAADVELKGILNQIGQREHREYRCMLQEHVLIGISEGRHAFIQFQNGLYLLNMEMLSHDFITQMLWKQLGKLEKCKLKTPLVVSIDQEQTIKQNSDADHSAHLASVSENTGGRSLDGQKKRAALDRLLSIEVSRMGHLQSLPLPLPFYSPKWIRMLSSCQELGKRMRNWNGSIGSLNALMDTLASLFSIQQDADGSNDDVRVILEWMRQFYIPSIDKTGDGSIIKVTTVDALCSKFDR